MEETKEERNWDHRGEIFAELIGPTTAVVETRKAVKAAKKIGNRVVLTRCV